MFLLMCSLRLLLFMCSFKVSIWPDMWDLTASACPYMWPFCTQAYILKSAHIIVRFCNTYTRALTFSESPPRHVLVCVPSAYGMHVSSSAYGVAASACPCMWPLCIVSVCVCVCMCVCMCVCVCVCVCVSAYVPRGTGAHN
jgi:hypothetical protein